MPVKLTWKSIAGVLSIVAGAVTAATNAGLPHSVDVVLIAVGGVIVAAERVADALDYGNTPKVTVPIVPAAPVSTSQTVTVPPGHTVQVVPVVTPGA